MLTHNHDDFPSDVFVIMAAVGATLSVGQSEDTSTHTLSEPYQTLVSLSLSATDPSTTQTMSLWDFLKFDMTKAVGN